MESLQLSVLLGHTKWSWAWTRHLTLGTLGLSYNIVVMSALSQTLRKHCLGILTIIIYLGATM
jgi:hypothetical protein